MNFLSKTIHNSRGPLSLQNIIQPHSLKILNFLVVQLYFYFFLYFSTKIIFYHLLGKEVHLFEIDASKLKMFLFRPHSETSVQLLYTQPNPILPMHHDKRIFFMEKVTKNYALDLIFSFSLILLLFEVLIINIFDESHEDLLNHLNYKYFTCSINNCWFCNFK